MKFDAADAKVACAEFPDCDVNDTSSIPVDPASFAATIIAAIHPTSWLLQGSTPECGSLFLYGESDERFASE